MNKFYISEISRLLQAVTDLTGVSAVWKNSAGVADEKLPGHQSLHCTPFCKKIKSRKGLIRKCSYNDCVIVTKRCEEIRMPFCNECHAGGVELIIPIIIGDVLDSIIFFGPFTGETSKCMYKFAEDEYCGLKRYERPGLDPVKEIFSTLVLFMIENREKLIRRQIAEKARDRKIQTALEFIDSNFKKPISASDAAAKCALSVSRFVHLFKEECGVGFSEYLTARRIDEAKRLLAETRMRACEIASCCGYAGQSYFGLVFRKSTGMSPNSYRKRSKRQVEP